MYKSNNLGNGVGHFLKWLVCSVPTWVLDATQLLQLRQGFSAAYSDTHSQELPFLAIQSAALSPSHISIRSLKSDLIGTGKQKVLACWFMASMFPSS